MSQLDAQATAMLSVIALMQRSASLAALGYGDGALRHVDQASNELTEYLARYEPQVHQRIRRMLAENAARNAASMPETP